MQFLVLTKGGDALNVAFNGVAVLFMCEIGACALFSQQ
jgi:hypothetical protein